MLDQLTKLKPEALDLQYEGNILYIRNNANERRNKLTPEELGKTLEFAKNLKVGRRLHISAIKN